MAAKKVIEVNETSIVDLKAELFRKEQQFRQESGSQKLKTDRKSSKKNWIWSKQKKPQSTLPLTVQDTGNDNEPSEQEKSLQKSREMLQAKAALYDKMAKGEIEENEDDDGNSGRFLVDFHKKSYNKEVMSQCQEQEEDDCGPPTPPPSCADEEWVDYVDSLGRSRRCLRKDLKQLQHMEKDIRPEQSHSPPTLLSDDMRREIVRKKWEKEEEEAMSKPVGPVHYQNIQFDEVRNHGVGYYQFSKIEEERQKQMETLNKLREQTQDQRLRMEKIKDKRKAALEARLSKVRARKKIKTGESVENDDSRINTEQNEQENSKIYEKEKEILNAGDDTKEMIPEQADTDVKANSGKRPLPEWAQHKIKQPSAIKSYVNQRRDERPDEFAPPSIYYDTTEDKKNKNNTKGSTHSNKTQDQDQHYDYATTQDTTVINTPPLQYLPPVSNFSAPSVPLHGGMVLPNLPPPPVDFTHTPPPGFPPFPTQNYPPFPPPFNYNIPPPNVQPLWQQFPRQQEMVQPQTVSPRQQYLGQLQTSSNETTNTSVPHQWPRQKQLQKNDVTSNVKINDVICSESCSSNQTARNLVAKNQDSEQTAEKTGEKQTADIVADFVTSIRQQK